MLLHGVHGLNRGGGMRMRCGYYPYHKSWSMRCTALYYGTLQLRSSTILIPQPNFGRLDAPSALCFEEDLILEIMAEWMKEVRYRHQSPFFFNFYFSGGVQMSLLLSNPSSHPHTRSLMRSGCNLHSADTSIHLQSPPISLSFPFPGCPHLSLSTFSHLPPPPP